MNKLMANCGGKKIDIAFTQKRLGQNDNGMKEPAGHGNRESFRAKYAYRTGARAELGLAATNNFGDVIVRFDLSRTTSNVASSLPGSKEFEDAVKKKREIDSE